jgi:serine/threonine protein kinase
MSTRHQRDLTGEALPQVFGRYLLVKRLSRGGMGEIFLARHGGLSGFEKLVVIKKVLPHLAEDEQFISRFIDEAQVAIKLQHAHIAQVFEVGRVNDEYFLALEYVEGRDLRRTLQVLDDAGERLPVDLALLIARDVAGGLSYAHRRTDEAGNSLELVHCDISPPNIMVSFEGETKIIDFGIAKSAMRATATDPKMGFGKFGYMAPEQLIRGGEVDFRTDIYANGVVLFELLTGRRMYEMGESPDYRALARCVARGQHPLPSQLDPALAPYDELVSVALRPNPDDRYQTAAEFRDAIQHALVTVNPTASPEALGEFMRARFEEEMVEQRQAIAQAEATDLEPWVIELTTQSSTTVSYAVANMPLVAEPESSPEPAAPPPIPEPAAPSRPIDTAGTQLVSRPLAAPGHYRSRRRGVTIALVLVAMLVSGSVLAWVLSRGDDGASVAAAGAEPTDEVGGPAVAQLSERVDTPDAPVEEIAMPPVEVDPVDETTADGADGPAAEPPRKARPTRRTAKRRPKRKSKPAASKPELSAADVESKFRRLANEYRSFKKSYGARLEKEWADLAHYATYARSQDKLRVLDRRIGQFRSRMRKVKQ